jgi:hypothetical protein
VLLGTFIPVRQTVAPDWTITTSDAAHSPLTGITVREVWQQYSLDDSSHEEDRLTDNKGHAQPANQDSFVTPAELHALRDSHFASSKLIWAGGIQNMWSMRNIYAVGPDGKVAGGCRALEAIRIRGDLANQPNNLRGARALLKKDVMLSDTITVPATPRTQTSRGSKRESRAGS